MIDNIILVDEHSSNRFLYPYMLEYFDAVKKRQGFAYDTCNVKRKKIRLIVEYGSSVAAIVKDETCDKRENKYRLYISKLIEGVPLIEDSSETILLRGVSFMNSDIGEFNKSATNKIYSLIIVPSVY